MAQPMDISFIETLDDMCTEIHDADSADRHVTSVRVPRSIYDVVAAAKARQHLSRGNPLLLLGLDLVADERLRPGEFELR